MNIMRTALVGLALPILLSGLVHAGQAPVAEEHKGRVLPVEKNKIVLPEPIAFLHGKDQILPESHWVLDSVAATLETHMNVQLVEIGVHSDSRGSSAFNKRLSQQRAENVLRYLHKKGIPRERLSAVGYGEERPIDTNRTESGRAHNRRVEFVIL